MSVASIHKLPHGRKPLGLRVLTLDSETSSTVLGWNGDDFEVRPLLHGVIPLNTHVDTPTE